MHAKAFIGALICVVGSTVLAVAAETNFVVHADDLFVFSKPHLRNEFMAISVSPQITKPAKPKINRTDSFAAAKDADNYGFQRNQKFALIEPPHKPDNPVSRCFESVFKPEKIHVGKVAISCSILTAIKRKNPLCLLNPYFFNVSW